MIEAPEFLPLGSVINLDGNPHKLMVLSRAVLAPSSESDEMEYYDYAGCLFPEGMQGNVYLYFNHENIENVHFEGLEDEESQKSLDLIYQVLEAADYKKGNPGRIEAEW